MVVHAVPSELQRKSLGGAVPPLSETTRSFLFTSSTAAPSCQGVEATSLAEMSGFAPEIWNDLRFEAHPSAKRLDLLSNASAIWLALKNDETPPDAAALNEPSRLLVWRQDTTPMFRELSGEEAMMWDEATGGIPFGVLCSMLATYDDPDGAAARGAGYLHGWITSGVLSGVSAGD